MTAPHMITHSFSVAGALWKPISAKVAGPTGFAGKGDAIEVGLDDDGDCAGDESTVSVRV